MADKKKDFTALRGRLMAILSMLPRVRARARCGQTITRDGKYCA